MFADASDEHDGRKVSEERPVVNFAPCLRVHAELACARYRRAPVSVEMLCGSGRDGGIGRRWGLKIPFR